MFENI